MGIGGNTMHYHKNFNYRTEPSFNFVKSFLLPFICGSMGAIVILSVHSNLLVHCEHPAIHEAYIPTYANSLNHISLSSYSDTSIYVANKVLPSIASITVEFHSTQARIFTAEGSGIIISENRLYIN